MATNIEMQENIEIFNEYMAENASTQTSNSSNASSVPNLFTVGQWLKNLSFSEKHKHIINFLRSPEEQPVYPSVLACATPQDRYRWRRTCKRYRWHEPSQELYLIETDAVTKQGKFNNICI